MVDLVSFRWPLGTHGPSQEDLESLGEPQGGLLDDPGGVLRKRHRQLQGEGGPPKPKIDVFEHS